MLILDDIIEQYDPDMDNEIESVTKVGKMISERMNKYKCLQWTKFPDAFANCRTDAELNQLIDNWNKWGEIMGLCED